MDKARALLSAIGASLALTLLLVNGCAKPGGETPPASCASGQTSCALGCFDLTTNAQNCGSCGNACPAGRSCVGSACTCAPGLALCGTSCVSLASDHDHCGACPMACPAAQVCSNSQCSTGCTGGDMNCNGSCAKINTDVNNCGRCGMVCPAGQACNNGSCGCPSGQVVCNGSCATSCGGGQGGTPVVGGQGGRGGTTGSLGGGSGSLGGMTGSQGGAMGAQGGFTGMLPAGWWTSGSWHGCSWTAIDVVPNSMTTNNPKDFLTTTAAPYCVSGSVNATYESVAILGFNLNETPASATQCAYKPANPLAVGPAGVTLTSTGVALSFSKTIGSNLRIQLQGPNGGMSGTIGENDRWCYTITEVQGPIFAPFSKFNTHCWDNSGTAMPANAQISAVSFLVPGLPVPSPFAYCIGGFATGTSVTAAPAYTPTPANPVVAGTIGGPGPTDLDFQRVKVSPTGSTKQYIIQNNNWGTPAGTDQTMTYRGNSFTVMSTTGNVTGQGVPASFPSIYVGANGDTQSANDPPKGVYSTHPTDNLPKQISAIGTAMSTFSYNKAGGDFNATYDIWVSAGAPTSAYNDAISGFVMVWLYQPPGRSPIGTKQANTVTIGGNTYDVWVGPRNSGTNPQRPVVSYVANPSGVLSRTFDLKLFLADAASHGIPSTWFVTDIFGGFEVWTGSSAAGLQMTNFTVDVQ